MLVKFSFLVSLETGPFRCSKLLARGGNWFCLGPQVIGGSTSRDFHDWFNPLILISLYSVDKRESHPLDPNFQFINLWLRRATKELLDLSQKRKTCRIVKSFSIFALIMVLSHSALLHERLFYHKISQKINLLQNLDQFDLILEALWARCSLFSPLFSF